MTRRAEAPQSREQQRVTCCWFVCLSVWDIQAQIRNVESQEAVQKAVPSGEHIPNGNGVVADAGDQQTTTGREVDVIHREDDALLAVFADLTVCPQVEQTAA
ncbi:hypothetical protein T4B_5872 [Trichinella pseudospiralis]|uniref:Uncharacterized protein n=1 Tax=Trichinella pseudospiralis TaxID=6337 RepID=A0A0V1K884_TRIPS|nr:hypothetical protein T4B_5872 [Trichinella pseudospiralis]KRZ43437.1 hypothetical protein T4C_4794 [Trichinella pseudospiralis]